MGRGATWGERLGHVGEVRAQGVGRSRKCPTQSHTRKQCIVQSLLQMYYSWSVNISFLLVLNTPIFLDKAPWRSCSNTYTPQRHKGYCVAFWEFYGTFMEHSHDTFSHETFPKNIPMQCAHSYAYYFIQYERMLV